MNEAIATSTTDRSPRARVIVINHVSLDGVMQGPGRPDEDTRGGFAHGGWAAHADDPATSAAMSRLMGENFSWLFGRVSYEGMLSHWNSVGGPMADGLNRAFKLVASSNQHVELPWPNSRLVTGDVPAEVERIRDRAEGNLVIMGSGQLVQSLLSRGVIDDVLLMTHPLVLGSGRRLFAADEHAHRLQLTASSTTPSGVIIATYRTTAAA